VISYARRINRSDGSFAGTVYASINVDELMALLAQIKMPNGGSIALRDQDAGLLARHVFGGANPIPVGSTQLATPFARSLQHEPSAGTYVSDSSSADPVRRTYSYQRSDKYQFLVVVGLPMEQGFAEWRSQSFLVLAMASLLLLAVGFMVHVMIRSRVSLEALVASLENSQGELQQNHQRVVTGGGQSPFLAPEFAHGGGRACGRQQHYFQ